MKKSGKLILLLITNILTISIAHAQWGAPYSNSWINYGQPYVRIGVTQKGVHKLPFSLLPADFPLNQQDKLQLWHRGREVAILGIENSEIIFYAVPNDGASDSLLYRPSSSRINPHWSIYSDESAYFLTVGTSNGLRAESVSKAIDSSVSPVPFHLASLLATFKSEYSRSIVTFLRPALLNSFFESGASATGKISTDGKASNFAFQLSNFVSTDLVKPVVKILVHGRAPGSRSIEVYVGKNTQSLRLVNAINSTEFAGSEYSFELENEDVDEAKKGILSIKSVSNNAVDGYSVTYYSILYPQSINMAGKGSHDFKLIPSNNATSRLSMAGIDSKTRVLDVTDGDRPKSISGSSNEFMVPRVLGKALDIYASNETILVNKEKVIAVNFSSKYLPSHNYIIITSANLLAGANQYAEYRKSKDGGEYNVLVANIKDLYNQFNYGEPSPVAIRKFVDYMLSDKNRDKYLFLVGKSISFVERMIRELPDEVPTVGFPGSDMLLVEGLAGAPRDVPAIPVGRISAVSNKNIVDYLEKVKDYEHNVAGNYSWKKNILHLNGGKTVSEITQLKGILSSLAPAVKDGVVGGTVKAFVKQQAIGEVETVNITPEVNAGVGLITYFGHGSTTVTDLDMGYVTDAKRGYNNTNLYPLMYFNGCGVGNIFNGKYKGYPTTSDKDALSVDWMLAPKKGAVAIVANSLDSFVTPASKYLHNLYDNIFTDPLTSNLPIGNIQLSVAKKIISENANSYDIANVHQSLLQGDPSLILISEALPDYAIDSDQGIKIYSESPDKTIGSSKDIVVKFFLQNFGRFTKGDNVQLDINFFYKDSDKVSSYTVPSFAYQDTLSVVVPNDKTISRIEAKLDPFKNLNELSKENNIAELAIDWEIANEENQYPQSVIKDIVAPILDVRFNGRNIRNDEKLSPNPVISIALKDDRFITPDTSRIKLYLKSCDDNTCDFEKIDYSSDEIMSVSATSSRSIRLNYSPLNLAQAGTYELLVAGRDDSGNLSAEPYKIRFIITDQKETLTVVVSPNPASSFVRFETAIYNESYSSLEWTVYDASGRIVFADNISSPHSGVNEWYWHPMSISGGPYYYSVKFRAGSKVVKNMTGKLIIVR